MFSSTSWLLTWPILVFFFPYVTRVVSFSVAIPDGTGVNEPFWVEWERDADDPTTFTLELQIQIAGTTTMFGGGGAFAEIEGTMGESTDPQTTSCLAVDPGYVYDSRL
jgi:hypothetical protein